MMKRIDGMMTETDKTRMLDELLDDIYTLKEDLAFVDSRMGITAMESKSLQSIIESVDEGGRIMRYLVADVAKAARAAKR